MILDRLDDRAVLTEAINDHHQPVAMVPLVLGHFAGGDIRPLDAIPFPVVLVAVRPV